MMIKLLVAIGALCFCGVQSRHLPRDMTKYQNYNDEYIDQLRDRDWNPDWDTKDSYEEEYYDDYSGDDYSEEYDDDEDRDYREWQREREEQYNRNRIPARQEDPFYGMEDDWDPYYDRQQQRGQRRGRPSPKMDAYDRRPAYKPQSAYKNDDEVMMLTNKLSDMQNEINNMKGMLRRDRYPYKK